MANRFPLIANPSSDQIQELANADNLDLTGNNIVGVVDISASGSISIGGTLTYEDVTNVDSVGLITARSGVIVSGAGIGLSVTEGGVRVAGVVTATTFVGALTGTASLASNVTGTPNISVGTLDTSNTATFSGGLVEKYENAGTTLGSQPNNPLPDGNVILFTGNESGNLTINFTGVHATVSSEQNVSFTAVISPNNSGRINVVQIDGVSQTVQWLGGSVPTAGSSGRDVYTFTLLKTGTGTTNYIVLGAASNFA